MKRAALILILGTNLYFVSAVSVMAQGNMGVGTEASAKTTTTSEDDKQKRIEDQKAVLKERKAALNEAAGNKQATREAMKQDRIEARSEHLSEVATMRFEKIVRRFNAAVARLEQIIGRFNTRLEALTAEGHDTAEAQALVDTAAEHVVQAQALIAEAEEQFVLVSASDNPASAFVTVKEAFNGAKAEFIEAHKSLRSALTQMRALQITDAMTQPSTEASAPAAPVLP